MSGEHDYRCQGECVACHGADACGMVGHSCTPCTGQCASRATAVTESMIDRFCKTYNQMSGRVPQREYIGQALSDALEIKAASDA